MEISADFSLLFNMAIETALLALYSTAAKLDFERRAFKRV